VRLPVRRRAAARPVRRRRRRVRLVNWIRLGGAAMVLCSSAGLAWLVSAEEFELDGRRVELSGLHYTDAELVRSIVQPWLDGRPNIFRLPAAEIERTLDTLPAVAHSDVRLSLPRRVEVILAERTPVFVWRTPAGDFLVDATGVLLHSAGAEETGGALPVLRDDRHRPAPPELGQRLEGVDLEAVLKLGALTPELLGSDARRLQLAADDDEGYAITAEPYDWRAVFGHYTPNLRPPDIIERQVQCLRALLADEPGLQTVYLSPADDRCGTFVAQPTPVGAPADRDGPGTRRTAPPWSP
jgi:cell division septal protein FtsQ